MEIKTLDKGELVIKLGGDGYFLLEPLERVRDSQDYSATLKLNGVASILGYEIAATGKQPSEILKGKVFTILQQFKQSIENIQQELGEKP